MAILATIRLLRSTFQTQLIAPSVKLCELNLARNASTQEDSKKTHWLSYNDKVFPPQKPGEEPRPAYVCHQKSNIKYSPKKMWYIACLIRGMSVDEAIKQLKFLNRKGAIYVKEVLEEAKDLAVKEHNVEYASNLWVAESFTNKGEVIKGIRRHSRARVGKVCYVHCNYYVRLEEGKPPKDYYGKNISPSKQLQDWLDNMRGRKIYNSL